MRTLTRLALASALALTLSGGLRADAGPGPDRLTLKDGRVIAGTIVQEDVKAVTLRSGSMEREYRRDFIRSIAYGETPPPATVPGLAPTPAARASSLDADLCQRYNVPLSEVQWVRRQGMADADLPLVFFVAATAQVVPGPVVALRKQGLSWEEIERHYGMEPKHVHFVVGPWVPYPVVEASILWPFWLLNILTHAHR
jgi:hypothetical protein